MPSETTNQNRMAKAHRLAAAQVFIAAKVAAEVLAGALARSAHVAEHLSDDGMYDYPAVKDAIDALNPLLNAAMQLHPLPTERYVHEPEAADVHP